MANLNRVLLMGNLTRDPEVKYTPKGTAVGNFSLAINETYKAQDGSTKETTTYVDVEAWGKSAETLKQYVAKGSPLFVEGKLKLDQWESDGQKRSKLKIVLESFQFLGGGRGQRDGNQNASYAPSRAIAGPPSSEDDIPF